MTENLLKQFEQEFNIDTKDVGVDLIKLQKLGIKKETLALELYLTNVYGNEIFNIKSNTAEENKPKTVEKLTEFDFTKNEELNNILLELGSSDFDDRLNKIMISIRESEEWREICFWLVMTTNIVLSWRKCLLIFLI